MQVYFLLDRSGSMVNQWSEALGSINGYIGTLPNATKVQLATFDTVSYDIIRDTTVNEWIPLNDKDAQPRGGTPLYDSAMRMMQRAMETDDQRTVFVLMTDGFENASQHYKKHDVVEMVKKFKSKDWEVVFLGANFDAISDVAINSGITWNKFLNITPQNMYDTMTRTVGASTASYLSHGTEINYTDTMKKEAVKENN